MGIMKIETSYEVWKAIRIRHHSEMVVFSSYTVPGGDMFGDLSRYVMETDYGFKGADAPTLSAKTTWDISPSNHMRLNEKHEYWLCVYIKEEED